MEAGGGWEWVQALILIASVGLLIYMAAKQTSEAMKLAEQEQVELYTVVRCGDGSTRTREFREGDYVGASVDECEGGVVVGVYARKPGEEEKRRRKL